MLTESRIALPQELIDVRQFAANARSSASADGRLGHRAVDPTPHLPLRRSRSEFKNFLAEMGTTSAVVADPSDHLVFGRADCFLHRFILGSALSGSHHRLRFSHRHSPRINEILEKPGRLGFDVRR
jgi:hypothetical protein